MSVAKKDRIFASINNTHDEYYLDDHIDILQPKTAKTNKSSIKEKNARRIRLRKTGDDITKLVSSPLQQQNSNINGFVRERKSITRRKRKSRAAEKIIDRVEHMTLLPDTKNLVIVPQAHKSDDRAAAAEEIATQGGASGKNFFVNIFRGSAAYIASHRDSTMVFHIPAELLEWEGFGGLIDDIALAWLLGIKLVIVVGCRSLVDRQLESLGIEAKVSNGRRVTDKDTLEIVKMQAGYARFEVERM